MGALVGYVPLHDGDEVRWVGPGDELTEQDAARIGEHAFEDGEHPFPGARAAYLDPAAESTGKHAEPVERAEGTPPPKAGTGSGRDNWLAYADEMDVEVPKGTPRDAIIQLLVDAGKPVDPAPAGD
jgi:hypothetical protein